jgi:hypothetical protein
MWARVVRVRVARVRVARPAAPPAQEEVKVK